VQAAISRRTEEEQRTFQYQGMKTRRDLHVVGIVVVVLPAFSVDPHCLSHRLLFHLYFFVQLPFPIKLHDLLEDTANNGSQNVVSWQPHGKAFRVHQPEVFARAIMPRYFKQTKYKSFLRQLHVYGFRRIKEGVDEGAYFHGLFIENKKSMSLRMVCEKIKGTSSSAGKKNDGQQEHAVKVVPNFYKKEEMVMMEDHPPHYIEHRHFAISTMAAKPVAVLASTTEEEVGFAGVTAKNTFHRGGVGDRVDSWLCTPMAKQNIAPSSLEKNNSSCNFQSFTGNDVATTSIVPEEHIEDGVEAFFEGNRFYVVESAAPSPVVEDLGYT
jgi:hypothetical protein